MSSQNIPQHNSGQVSHPGPRWKPLTAIQGAGIFIFFVSLGTSFIMTMLLVSADDIPPDLNCYELNKNTSIILGVLNMLTSFGLLLSMLKKIAGFSYPWMVLNVAEMLYWYCTFFLHCETNKDMDMEIKRSFGETVLEIRNNSTWIIQLLSVVLVAIILHFLNYEKRRERATARVPMRSMMTRTPRHIGDFCELADPRSRRANDEFHPERSQSQCEVEDASFIGEGRV